MTCETLTGGPEGRSPHRHTGAYRGGVQSEESPPGQLTEPDAVGIDSVESLHACVDGEVQAITLRLGARITCRRGCSDCCVDHLTVFGAEADRIRRDAVDRLVGAEAHPAGACAFLDSEGACRIYEARPYVCRTQGMPLRWLDEADDGTVVEYRDICPLNDHGDPIEEIAESDCWTIGPAEMRLVRIQRASDSEGNRRVDLRELFLELSNRTM